MPRSTDASFQPRFQVSFIDTFMPWPALALCVWQASPAMNTRGNRLSISAAGTSSNLSQSRWPISYTAHQPTSLTSIVYGCRIRFATSASFSGVTLRFVEHLPVADVVQLDVDADQVAALARDDQDVAVVGGVDRALAAGCPGSR